jgi:hypothetical protein
MLEAAALFKKLKKAGVSAPAIAIDGLTRPGHLLPTELPHSRRFPDIFG